MTSAYVSQGGDRAGAVRYKSVRSGVRRAARQMPPDRANIIRLSGHPYDATRPLHLGGCLPVILRSHLMVALVIRGDRVKAFPEADQYVIEVSAPCAAVDLDDPAHGPHGAGHVIQGDVLRDGLSLLRSLEKAACADPQRGEDFSGREFSPQVAGEAPLGGNLVPDGGKELLKPLCGR